jgi:hypothetical protein
MRMGNGGWAGAEKGSGDSLSGILEIQSLGFEDLPVELAEFFLLGQGSCQGSHLAAHGASLPRSSTGFGRWTLWVLLPQMT